jgi:hypothetical protein
MPSGIALARPLGGYGPLVTSVSLNIDSSVKTTVRMDLYTSRFGKLQKQKEEVIAAMVREKQKIIDQNNKMIRNGLLRRSLSNINIKQALENSGGRVINKLIEPPITHIVASNNRKTQTFSNGKTKTNYNNRASLQRDGDVEAVASVFGNFNDLAVSMSQTAGAAISEIFTAVSNIPSTEMIATLYGNHPLQQERFID